MLFAVVTKILASIFDYESIFKYVQAKSFVHFPTFPITATYCFMIKVPRSFAGDGTQRALTSLARGPNCCRINVDDLRKFVASESEAKISSSCLGHSLHFPKFQGCYL